MGFPTVCKSCVIVLGLALLGAGPAPLVSRPPAAREHHALTIPPANRHLHGATSATRVRKASPHVERSERTHRIWHHRWQYWHWLSSHRGSGTIVGTVVDKQEKPVAHAHVVLRSPRGRYLKWSLKHVTTADSAGHFIMRRVRPGSYRVHSSSGKAHGNVPVHVHSGVVLHETVRI